MENAKDPGPRNKANRPQPRPSGTNRKPQPVKKPAGQRPAPVKPPQNAARSAEVAATTPAPEVETEIVDIPAQETAPADPVEVAESTANVDPPTDDPAEVAEAPADDTVDVADPVQVAEAPADDAAAAAVVSASPRLSVPRLTLPKLTLPKFSLGGAKDAEAEVTTGEAPAQDIDTSVAEPATEPAAEEAEAAPEAALEAEPAAVEATDAAEVHEIPDASEADPEPAPAPAARRSPKTASIPVVSARTGSIAVVKPRTNSVPAAQPKTGAIAVVKPAAVARAKSTSAAGSDVVLRVEGLTKRFDDKVAVNGIDLEVHIGAFYGIVGPNGAGKTTTLSMITGLLRPNAGSITVHGADVWSDPVVAKRNMGVLPDRLRLFDRLTGAQVLYYAGVLRGLDSATVRKRTGDLAAAFGLEDALSRLVTDYSSGMTKKIALAAAMIHSPRILVLDEPFESVDPVSAATITEILKTYAAAGGTVVLSSHSMDLVQRICDNVAVIVGGDLLADGTMADVRNGQTLEQRFVELAGGRKTVEGLEWLHSFSD
ncbi:hypothetical protein BH11ACT4_BH11ACT4_11790 [soil metagenome]